MVFQPEIYGPTQNTRAEPAVRGLTRTRHDTRGFRVWHRWEGFIITGTSRKGGLCRDREEKMGIVGTERKGLAF